MRPSRSRFAARLSNGVPRMMRYIAKVIVIAAIISGCLFLFNLNNGNLTKIYSHYFANLDSETRGVMERSTVVNSGRSGVRPDIEYAYEVAGRRFKSRQISLLEDADFFSWNGAREYAHAVVSAYPEGSEVTIYYDSRQPGISVLEITALGWSPWMETLGSLIIALMLVWGVFWRPN